MKHTAKTILMVMMMGMVACGQNDGTSISPDVTPKSYVCAHASTVPVYQTCVGTHCFLKYNEETYMCVSDLGEECSVSFRDDTDKVLNNKCLDKNLALDAIL